jgi:hypothetical protein
LLPVWAAAAAALQVPHHAGTAFSKAAQHSYKSTATLAATSVLASLLRTALVCGIIKEEGGSSLQGSIQQQLQQTGLLQHQAAVMSALAADLRADAAQISAAAADTSKFGASTHSALDSNFKQVATYMGLIQRIVRMLWPSDATWLCDPSAHTTAAMRLSTASLQHVSSSVQHVLPGMLQAAPQQGKDLAAYLKGQAKAARALSSIMIDAVCPRAAAAGLAA